MRLEATQEAKAIEKAQKQAEREEKKQQKAVKKQQKANTTLQRKNEQNTRRQLDITAGAVKAVKTHSKRAILAPKKPYKTAVKFRKNTMDANSESKRGSERSNHADSNAAAASAAIAVTEGQNISRRGRTVTLPQRFRG
jgi:hypothetical protein